MEMNEQVKKELLNFDLSGIKVKVVERNQLSVQVIKDTQQLFEEVFGPDIDLNQVEDVCNFVLYTLPSWNNLKALKSVVIYNFWAFLIDDYLEKFEQDIEKWCKFVAERKSPGDGKLEKLFQLFITTAEENFPSEKSLDLLLGSALFWLKGFSSYNRMKMDDITDQEFIDFRLNNVGGYIVLQYARLGSGMEDTDQFESDENWIEFNKQAMLHVLFMNELFSLKKEVRSGEGMANYVCVKMRNNNLAAQEAVNQMIKEVQTIEERIYCHGQILKAKNIEGMDEYVNVIYEIIDGIRYWHSVCKRYII